MKFLNTLFEITEYDSRLSAREEGALVTCTLQIPHRVNGTLCACYCIMCQVLCLLMT